MGHVQNKQQNLIHSILFSSSRLWCILFLWIFYLFVFNSDTESRWIVQAGLNLTISSEFHFLLWHLTTIYHLPIPYQNLFETNNVLPTRKACTPNLFSTWMMVDWTYTHARTTGPLLQVKPWFFRVYSQRLMITLLTKYLTNVKSWKYRTQRKKMKRVEKIGYKIWKMESI